MSTTSKSVIDEAKQIGLAIELIELGARLQVLQTETDISRRRLINLYKEIHGVSPPKGMLPLKAAVAEGEPLGIGAAMYELLIEQCLDFDMKDNMMQKTAVDYANLEDPKVREKMQMHARRR